MQTSASTSSVPSSTASLSTVPVNSKRSLIHAADSGDIEQVTALLKGIVIVFFTGDQLVP
jgi:hypothetical protein